MAVASPTMQAEMNVWVREFGGINLGIVGNAAHKTGFHRAGNEIPPTDYSRRHDPGKPYNMNWACAGDFCHDGDARLRGMHADLLGRLMKGLHPMIDEFIGQPWLDKPVLYWARWNGITTLQKYTGSGHYGTKGGWSHISQRRSTAYLQPNLWHPPQPQPSEEDEMQKLVMFEEDADPKAVYVTNFIHYRHVTAAEFDSLAEVLGEPESWSEDRRDSLGVPAVVLNADNSKA